MSNKKISELAPITEIDDADVLPVVDVSALSTTKATALQIKSYITVDAEYTSVPTLADRDAILPTNRTPQMRVYCEDIGAQFVLLEDLITWRLKYVAPTHNVDYGKDIITFYVSTDGYDGYDGLSVLRPKATLSSVFEELNSIGSFGDVDIIIKPDAGTYTDSLYQLDLNCTFASNYSYVYIQPDYSGTIQDGYYI